MSSVKSSREGDNVSESSAENISAIETQGGSSSSSGRKEAAAAAVCQCSPEDRREGRCLKLSEEELQQTLHNGGTMVINSSLQRFAWHVGWTTEAAAADLATTRKALEKWMPVGLYTELSILVALVAELAVVNSSISAAAAAAGAPGWERAAAAAGEEKGAAVAAAAARETGDAIARGGEERQAGSCIKKKKITAASPSLASIKGVVTATSFK